MRHNPLSNHKLLVHQFSNRTRRKAIFASDYTRDLQRSNQDSSSRLDYSRCLQALRRCIRVIPRAVWLVLSLPLCGPTSGC